MNVITPEEFKNKMQELSNYSNKGGSNIEEAHELGDALMANILEQLGYKEGVDIFYDMIRWYS